VKRVAGVTMLVLLFVGIFIAARAAAGWEAAAMAFLVAFGIIAWVAAAVILATSNG